MLLFIIDRSASSVGQIIFQYIPCYCLSLPRFPAFQPLWISIHPMLLFIQNPTLNRKEKKNFNTSHVTVYPACQPLFSSGITDFNTSHVTVYPVNLNFWLLYKKFQYIPCYCLSFFVFSFCLHILYFNTSHVTVYRIRGCFRHYTNDISIHPMLLFISLVRVLMVNGINISIHPMLLFIQRLASTRGS